MTEPPRIERIGQDEMRRRFNEARFDERATAGELAIAVLEDRHPALTAASEPICTRSQMISYRDPAGNELARAHRYLRNDGSVGASGHPDPKRVYEGGILYRLEKKSKSPAAGQRTA